MTTLGKTLLFAAALLPVLAAAQESRSSDVWAPLRLFVGVWQGTGKGQPGDSKLERTYEFVLLGKFLHARHKSVYPPQEANPKGEVHEDWGFFSYDRSRKTLVFRQFHVEGFVNQYVLESSSPDGKVLVFRTEGIENIAPGWRARETYRIVSEDEFVETFELAAPGKDFEVYSVNRLRRRN